MLALEDNNAALISCDDSREAVVQELERFVEDMVVAAEENDDMLSVTEGFKMAVNLGEWLRQVRMKTVVQGAMYVPRTVKAIGEKAAQGDMHCAKLLFDYLNIMPVKDKAAAVAAVQVNVNAPTLKEMLVREGVEV